MKNTDQKYTLQNCPYLGLHDDQRTSLAYPSAWNYCYRSHPPASVSIAHQISACLCPEFVKCTVYQSGQAGSLPVDLRGSSSLSTRRRKSARRKTRRIAWAASVILLLIMAVIAIQRYFPGTLQSWLPSLEIVSSVAPDGVTPEASIPSTPVPVQSSPVPVVEVPASTQAISLPNPSPTPIPKRCGYTLDTPFGSDIKFSLHQIASGENLDKLAEKHQTTVDAIRAVNFDMPLPVWENWIVVIPVDVSDVKGLPAFEPYQADGTIFSLSDLALQLGVDIESISKYNAFTDACTVFRGWMIVPRTSPASSN